MALQEEYCLKQILKNKKKIVSYPDLLENYNYLFSSLFSVDKYQNYKNKRLLGALWLYLERL